MCTIVGILKFKYRCVIHETHLQNILWKLLLFTVENVLYFFLNNSFGSLIEHLSQAKTRPLLAGKFYNTHLYGEKKKRIVLFSREKKVLCVTSSIQNVLFTGKRLFQSKIFFFLLCTLLMQQSYDEGYNKKYTPIGEYFTIFVDSTI